MKENLAGTTAAPAASPLVHLAYLDALRGVAILAVLLVHVANGYAGGLPEWLVRLAAQGARGVQLFYVLSAFTLARSHAVRRAGESRPWRNYAIRRVARIGPMLWAVVPLYLWSHARFSYSSAHSTHFTAAHVLSVATFSNGWYPPWINTLVPGGWSIPIEISFYLVLPLFVTALRSVRRTLLAVPVSIAFGLGSFFLLRHFVDTSGVEMGEFLYDWFPAQLPVFLLGLVLYRWSDAATAPAHPERDARRLMSAALVAMAALTWLVPGMPLQHIMFAGALLFLVRAQQLCPSPVLVNQVTIFFGRVSYSAYLLHLAIKLQLDHYIPAASLAPAPAEIWLRVAVLAALTGIAGWFTYQVIELPGQRAGRQLIDWLERRTSPEQAGRVTLAARG